MIADVLIVGAGPAGMAAAVRLRHAGLSVVVVDDAPAPGGQVWRAAETNTKLATALGTDYARGRAAIARFRACGAVYLPQTELWRLDEGWHAFTKRDGTLDRVDAKAVILATGALERPVPFVGWTLPGVVTVGGAQTLLKSAGQIPEAPVWIAGSGPLILLYAMQIVALGGQVAGWLDTSPVGNKFAAGVAALGNPLGLVRHVGDLAKGMRWRLKLALARVPVFPVHTIAAEGAHRIEAIRFVTRDGTAHRHPAKLLLVHEGIVPNIHATVASGCAHDWFPAQDCFVPRLDAYGMTNKTGLFVAGDGGGILGVRAAELSGTLAALGVLARERHLAADAASAEAHSIHRGLKSERALRTFLDALYRPRPDIFNPPDETLVCRCEEVTAGLIRKAANVSGIGPNQVKAFTRAGMGPCQARHCGATLTAIIAAHQGRSMEDVGYLNIRPPLKPVTVGELARAAETETT